MRGMYPEEMEVRHLKDEQKTQSYFLIKSCIRFCCRGFVWKMFFTNVFESVILFLLSDFCLKFERIVNWNSLKCFFFHQLQTTNSAVFNTNTAHVNLDHYLTIMSHLILVWLSLYRTALRVIIWRCTQICKGDPQNQIESKKQNRKRLAVIFGASHK